MQKPVASSPSMPAASASPSGPPRDPIVEHLQHYRLPVTKQSYLEVVFGKGRVPHPLPAEFEFPPELERTSNG